MSSTRREFIQTGAAAAAGLWLPNLSRRQPAAPHGADFQPTWASLAQYQTPDWFRDAKFGMWAHWGPQCVPEYGDWYARNMYVPGQRQYVAHLARYGHPSKSGFKDIIRQWRADPAHPDADREIAVFGRDGFAGNREGIAILGQPGGKGYLVCADQRSGDSEYRIYTRDNQHTLLGVVRGGADATDGIDIVSRPLGSRFPSGLLIAMNNRDRNFLIYRWSDISRAAGLRYDGVGRP